MSAIMESAPITAQPVADKPVDINTAATNAVIEGAGPAAVASEDVPPFEATSAPLPTDVEPKTSTTIKEETVKPATPHKEGRTFFGNLTNKLNRKEKTSGDPKKEEAVEPVKPVEEATVKPVEEAPKEAAVEPIAVPGAVEPSKEAEPAAAETGSPKRGGFLDKLKHLLDPKPKAEKETKKSSKEPSAEEAKTEEAANVEAAPAETTVTAPVVEADKPVEAAPPVVETPTVVASDAPVEATPAVMEAGEPATEEAIKSEEAAEKAKKDKKLGRRLSARLFGFASPKKEKTNPLASPSEESKPEDATAVAEQPAESTLPEPVPVPEPSSSTALPLVADESKPLEAAPVAAVEPTKTAEPLSIPATIADAPAVTKTDEPETASPPSDQTA